MKPTTKVYLAILPLLAACGGGAPDAGTTTSASTPATAQPAKVKVEPPRAAAPKARANVFEPAILVPADTVAVVRIASLAALEAALLEVGAVAERAGNALHLQEHLKLALSRVGLDPTLVRSGEPIVAAIRLPQGSNEPEVVVYAPLTRTVKDPSGMTAQTALEGDYVAITRAGITAPEPGCPAWCEGLDGDLVSMRADLRRIGRRFAPMVSMALARGMDTRGLPPETAQQVRQQQEMLLELLSSARQLDLEIGLTSGKLTIATGVEVEGGPVAAQASTRGNVLSALARHLASDAPIVAALAYDPANSAQSGTDDLAAALSMLPPGMAESFESVHGSFLDFLQSFALGAIVQVDPTPGAMHMALVMRSNDPTASRSALGDLLAAFDLDRLGFDLSLPERQRLGGAVVEDFTFRFDTRRLDFDARAGMRRAFASFLGDEDLHLFVAATGNEMMFLLGGDTSTTQSRLRRFAEPGEAPPELAARLAEVGNANPGAVWRVDLGRLVTLGAELEAAANGGSGAAARREAERAVPGLGRVPLIVWGAARPDRAFGGLEVDLEDLEGAARLLPRR
jgi:hypothetical protein